MTSPIQRPALPYLHIDDLTVHIPASTDHRQLLQELSKAAKAGEPVTVAVVDESGTTVPALVMPGNARLVAVSRAGVLVRKNRPAAT